MRHHSVKNDTSGDHYAVSSVTSYLPGVSEPSVLVQLQESGEQVRLSLTSQQAIHMAQLLLEHASKVLMAEPLNVPAEA